MVTSHHRIKSHQTTFIKKQRKPSPNQMGEKLLVTIS